MRGCRRRALGSLLAASALLIGAPAALAQTGADDPGTQAKTTQATVDRANQLRDQACAAAAASAAARDADPTNVEKTAKAAADAADCAAKTANAVKESASLAAVNGGIATAPANPTLPADVQNPAANAGQERQHRVGLQLARCQLEPDQPQRRQRQLRRRDVHPLREPRLRLPVRRRHGRPRDLVAEGPGQAAVHLRPSPPRSSASRRTPTARPTPPGGFYEGENPTVDSRRKLAFLARDPRSFGNNNHPGGRTGLYIIDVKNPWNPEILSYSWVPAGHTATCINDCRYLWSVGPANNGSRVNGQPQDGNGYLDPPPPATGGVVPAQFRHPEWTGVPAFVTDVRDPMHPYTYAQPVDMKRNNNTTAYTHSVDVDQDGIAWTSGFGGVRGFYTHGLRHDPVLNVDRYATATDPVPYAGGSVPSLETPAQYAQVSLEHNSFHVTQAASDKSSPTVTTASGENDPQDRPAVRHAGERRELHLDQRRRLRAVRDRQPRRQLRRQGVGPEPGRERPDQALLHREARRLHAA